MGILDMPGRVDSGLRQGDGRIGLYTDRYVFEASCFLVGLFMG